MPARKPNSGPRSAIPGRLAPGMRLPRELVAESQRARLSIALVELVDAQGFADTRLADLTARAHVARAAFYEHFGSMEGCFTAAYDEHLARAVGQLVAAYNAPGMEDGERALAALSALAAFAQVWPAAARVCLGDVLTVAQGTIEARDQELEGARGLLDAALGEDGAHANVPALVIATVGAIRRALYVHLRERPARELAALAEQLLDWVSVYAQAPPGGLDGIGAVGIVVLGAAEGEAGEEGPKERILQAVLKLAAGKEGESINLADIAAEAGVSFGTFYKHFRTSQEALLAACEAVHERLLDQARAAHAAKVSGDDAPATAPEKSAEGALPSAPDGTAGDGALAGRSEDVGPDAPAWAVGISRALGAYLNAAAAEPAATRTMVLGSLSLGRPGLDFLDRRAQALKQLLGPGLHARPDLPASVADMLAGAILELVHDHALRDQLERLPELHEQLALIVLAPLLAAHEGKAPAEHLLETPHASATLAAKRARARR